MLPHEIEQRLRFDILALATNNADSPEEVVRRAKIYTKFVMKRKV